MESAAAQLITEAKSRGWAIACAESLTGGLLSDAFVSVPGASAVFLGSAVTYHLAEKRELLGVDGDLLAREGAVDPQVAEQMASGVQRLYSRALPEVPLLTLATTGVAGPDSDGYKPVGLVYVAVAHPVTGAVSVSEVHVAGDRAAVRAGAVNAALDLAVTVIS